MSTKVLTGADLSRVNWVARKIQFGEAKKNVNLMSGIKANTLDRYFIATSCGIASFLV